MKEPSTWHNARTVGSALMQSANTVDGGNELAAMGKNFLHYIWRIGFLIGLAFLVDLMAGSKLGWLSPSSSFQLALIPGALAMIAIFGAYYMNLQSEMRAIARNLVDMLEPVHQQTIAAMDGGTLVGDSVDEVPTRHAWQISMKFLAGGAKARRAPWSALRATARYADLEQESVAAMRHVGSMVQAELGRVVIIIPLYYAIQIAIVSAMAAVIPAFQTEAMALVLLLALAWLGWQTIVVFTQRT